MTKKEIEIALKERAISYDANASESKLKSLLQEALASENKDDNGNSYRLNGEDLTGVATITVQKYNDKLNVYHCSASFAIGENREFNLSDAQAKAWLERSLKVGEHITTYLILTLPSDEDLTKGRDKAQFKTLYTPSPEDLEQAEVMRQFAAKETVGLHFVNKKFNHIMKETKGQLDSPKAQLLASLLK